MNILKIVTALCVSVLFPNENAMQSARMGQIIDIQQEYLDKHCDRIELLPNLSDAFQCYTLRFMLEKKDSYIKTGEFYTSTESGFYEITSYNKNQDNIQDAPYGRCEHQLHLRTLDKSEPLDVYQTLVTKCFDPVTNKKIPVDLEETRKRYLK